VKSPDEGSIGVSTYGVTARQWIDLAVAADETGFDSVWLGEHVVLPLNYASAHPTEAGENPPLEGRPIIDPETELLDTWTALGGAATATSRVHLATGVYLLALRHPLATARAAATLHSLAAGRVVFALGAGWLKEEFDALGVPFSGRGQVFEECLSVLRRALAGGPFSHEGPRFRFDQVQVVRSRVDIPIVLGGNSPTAMRRAARLGDAWFASGIPSLAEAKALHARMRAALDEVGRIEPFHCYFRIPGRDPDDVERYRDAGLHDLVLWCDDLAPGWRTDGARPSLARYAEQRSLLPNPNSVR
jgi:probable F420-dependent oxidoreductase